ncbi:aldehyde dehydrogenase family protein [Nocardia sp. NBC_00881]|uniref:aldehyde dehydrogenase family protein n=1 Tax=Nocardia sp. NBC_00881 TaxID=2975995 RepID=UPI003865C5F2|nr:aldehyde dehydrogenase family protein [Nocardia sp. NBC_00881]
MTDSITAARELAVMGLPDVLHTVVAGDWSVSEPSQDLVDVDDPATGEVIVRFAPSSADQVDVAVHSAQEAQRQWTRRDPADRGRVLLRIADALRSNADTLARLETLDCGKPLAQAAADIALSARYFEYYAGAADKFGGETIPQPTGTFAYTAHEALGVVAHITPWNAPLSQLTRGIAPCLAVGNAVVVKPSELTPITTVASARIFVEAGLPADLCNVVLGLGTTTGEALTHHPLVRHITFTGSVAAGRRVGAVAAERIVGINLELGGKSPTIVCADADLDSAAQAGALAVIRNSGQSCFATTRLLVDRAVHDRFVELVAERIDGLSVGHGLDDPDVGPLISARQKAKVLGMIGDAASSGARVVVGGTAAVVDSAGHFVQPTLLADVTNDMPVARQEIFGPVQSILAFDTLDEAIDVANDTEYGLSAGVFTRDIGRAHTVAGALQAGQVQINRYTGAGVEVPFGGYKNSGLGREKGMAALRHYTQLKSVIMAIP